MIYRLPPIDGEWIDRSRTLRFTFEGESVAGFAGDTISSALAASGRMVMARSFKYHRPRGVVSFANHDANILLQDGMVPNVRADVQPLAEGAALHAVNTFGGLARDRARRLAWLSRFLPVGFYYKTFLGRRSFPAFERRVRALSGLGRVDLDAIHRASATRYAWPDVLVIGAGVAGMSAALAAAGAAPAARVLLVEESAGTGGTAQHSDAARTLLERIRATPQIELLCCAAVVGCYADRWVAISEGDRLTKVRARAIVLASGAFEQAVAFAGNDLPGVMFGSAAQRLLFRHALAPGRNVVIMTSHATGYEVAADLLAHGVNVGCVLEFRDVAPGTPAVGKVTAANVPIITGCAAITAEPGDGGALAGVAIHLTTGRRAISCDALLVSTGSVPALQLALQAGATTQFDATLQATRVAALPEGWSVAGRANAMSTLEARIADGHRAGLEAAALVTGTAVAVAAPAASTLPLAHPYPVFLGSEQERSRAFVDFDEDLTIADLENAVQEGFDSSELLKRYSTVGMGPSQGKLSNPLAARILARLRQCPVADIALTTSRPPYHPVSLRQLAGRGFSPWRRTPLDGAHAALDAVWMNAGQWRRAEYYRRPGLTRRDCIEAEALQVRNGVGLIDVGTLGKIELRGVDAVELLERMYTGRFADLAVGSTRYALLLDESGTVIDDGVVGRLAPQHFYFTTTTGGSAGVYREMLRRCAQWRLDCVLHNLTGQQAALNLAGPASRAVLSQLTSLAIDDVAFPFLGLRKALVAGTPCLAMRVGFVGELGYELHVPFGEAAALWNALFAAGAAHGIRAFGVEAQRLLRLEKGHLIVGQDTDGLTNPYEARAGWCVRMNKPFFVGQRSLEILKARGPKQLLAGFELPAEARASGEIKECHLVIDAGEIAGRVTSVAWSPTLQRFVGLAMVSPALARAGATLNIRLDGGQTVAARVVPAPFYDPEGQRQRGATATPAEMHRAA